MNTLPIAEDPAMWKDDQIVNIICNDSLRAKLEASGLADKVVEQIKKRNLQQAIRDCMLRRSETQGDTRDWTFLSIGDDIEALYPNRATAEQAKRFLINSWKEKGFESTLGHALSGEIIDQINMTYLDRAAVDPKYHDLDLMSEDERNEMEEDQGKIEQLAKNSRFFDDARSKAIDELVQVIPAPKGYNPKEKNMPVVSKVRPSPDEYIYGKNYEDIPNEVHKKSGEAPYTETVKKIVERSLKEVERERQKNKGRTKWYDYRKFHHNDPPADIKTSSVIHTLTKLATKLSYGNLHKEASTVIDILDNMLENSSNVNMLDEDIAANSIGLREDGILENMNQGMTLPPFFSNYGTVD